jgi:Rod binding domain-containing protein
MSAALAPLAATGASAAVGSTAAVGTSGSGVAGLPLVNEALEPASVRNGSPATQKAYASALSFEDMLVQQLSQSLTQASGTGESGGEEGEEGSEDASALGGGEAAGGELSSLLPQALTEGVMSQGGLGLAQQLMPGLDPSAATAGGAAGGELTAAGGTAASPATPSGATVSSPIAPAMSKPSQVAPSGGVVA